MRGVMALAARHALLRGLRRQGSETELTQTLASVFAAEPRMAAQFVQLVFGEAPHGARVNLRGLPEHLECRAEHAVAEGRVDLSFVDELRRWHVIVEIKIRAGYGPNQVCRYLQSLDGAPRAALVAVTRDVPTRGDSAGDDRRWAGSVQWARLLPGLRSLTPTDPDLAAQWPLFLDVLEEEGSMGFTEANEQLFKAWAAYPDARNHLVDFVDTLRRASLEALNRELGAAAGSDPTLPRAATEVSFGKSGRVVSPRFGKIVVGYQIPADRPGERLWIGLWGWSEPRFMVEVPYPAQSADLERRAETIEALLTAGFESWRDRLLTRYLTLDEYLLSSPALETSVLDFAAESFGILARSGVFDLASVPVPEPEMLPAEEA